MPRPYPCARPPALPARVLVVGVGAMTPGEFIVKWRASELKERSASQEHFIDLCRLFGEPTPAEADAAGERYRFERGARKDIGGDGWADVWKCGCFAWEYKGSPRRPRRGVQPVAAVRSRIGEPTAADRLRHGAVPHPHQLDQQRERDARIHARRSRRRCDPRQAQVGDVWSRNGCGPARRGRRWQSARRRPSRNLRRD